MKSQHNIIELVTRPDLVQIGPASRGLIARCITNLFTVGDTNLLFESVKKCNDVLKNKDDSSDSFLSVRLTAIKV